jgi:hypothetical protein
MQSRVQVQIGRKSGIHTRSLHVLCFLDQHHSSSVIADSSPARVRMFSILALSCLIRRPEMGRFSFELSIYGSTALNWVLAAFSVFDLLQSVRRLGRGISPSQGRYIHTGHNKQNKRIQTSITRVRFETTIPVLERA